MTTSTYDALLERVSAGEPLGADVLADLASTPDILQLGMLADIVRRRQHGTRVTYLRVARCGFDQPLSDAVPPSTREVRLTGKPESLDVIVTAVEAARAIAGNRTISALSWLDVERLGASGGIEAALRRLRSAGLDAVAEMPLDRIADPAAAIGALIAAGFEQVRLTVEKAPAPARTDLFVTAAQLHEKYAAVRSISPLPSLLDALRPTTGYDDVKSVAIARLAAPNISVVQIDWLRYGPKLAQVALTFGADDFDNVTAGDEAPDGLRRAPLEEVRRNIEAAGFESAERDGRFGLIA